MTAHLSYYFAPLVAYGVGDWPPCRDMGQIAAHDPELARRVAVARGIADGCPVIGGGPFTGPARDCKRARAHGRTDLKLGECCEVMDAPQPAQEQEGA